jgi:hypothetical protein
VSEELGWVERNALPYDENPTHCSCCGKEQAILLLGGPRYNAWFCFDCYAGTLPCCQSSGAPA